MKKDENIQHDPIKCLACLAGIEHKEDLTIWCHDHQTWCNNHKETDLVEEPGEQFERIKQGLDCARRSNLKLFSTRLLE